MSNDNVTKSAVISDEQEKGIFQALMALHGIIGTYGGAPSITFEEAVKSGKVGQLSTLAVTAVKDLHESRRAARIAQYRTAVEGATLPFTSGIMAAREAIAALPESVRQFVPAVPSVAFAPLVLVYAALPQDMPVSEKNALLTSMGYKFGYSAKGVKQHDVIEVTVK